jgi:aryl-alcohol dehydrogenase-like predicted oxidoreductase
VNQTSSTRPALVDLAAALEGSLRRLRTDYIDVYWVHFSDQVTPIEEIVAAFDSLSLAGKIRHAGLSNFAAWRTGKISRNWRRLTNRDNAASQIRSA